MIYTYTANRLRILDPSLAAANKRLELINNEVPNRLKKAANRTKEEATLALKDASGHFGDTFKELNRRLMTYEPTKEGKPDTALELFEAEKMELFDTI